MTSLRLLFLSTSVGSFGSGVGGGVELTIGNVAQELIQRGHIVHLVACNGSYSPVIPIVNVGGTPPLCSKPRERPGYFFPRQFRSSPHVAVCLSGASQL